MFGRVHYVVTDEEEWGEYPLIGLIPGTTPALKGKPLVGKNTAPRMTGRVLKSPRNFASAVEENEVD